MTAYEFLKSKDCFVSRDTVAQMMFPGNKYAKTYLSKKLNGHKVFTPTDESNALRVLKELAVKIDSIGSD